MSILNTKKLNQHTKVRAVLSDTGSSVNTETHTYSIMTAELLHAGAQQNTQTDSSNTNIATDRTAKAARNLFR